MGGGQCRQDHNRDQHRDAENHPGELIYDVEPRAVKIHTSTDETDSGSLSPDGTIIATGNRDGMISLRRTQDGVEIQRFKAHECGPGTRVCIKSILFTPDGTRLVSGGNDGKLVLSDAW